MQLIKISQDRQQLTDDLFDMFKEHLRILHDVEDNTIRLYLEAAIDGIGIFGDSDVFPTMYELFYTSERDIKYPSSWEGWYCGKWNISDVAIYNTSGVDETQDYTIDKEHGMIYPHPLGNQVSFKTGYLTGDDVPAHLKTIIFRYGAHLFENRESVRVGEPKMIPDWVQYAMASIWTPRT